MKPITDPSFRYQPSFATDLRKTFARLKRERRTQKKKPHEVLPAVRLVHSRD